MVNVTMNNMPMPIYTYTHSSKSIFTGGCENHVKRLGIGIPSKCQLEGVVEKLNGLMSATDITDGKILTPIRSLQGDNGMRILCLDTSNIQIIGEARAKDSLLNIKEIYNKVRQLEIAKLQ